jgi:heptosyltransferase-2
MIDRRQFVSKRNFYLILALHYCLFPIYLLSKALFLFRRKNSKVLFIELGHLGDALMATPAIALCREHLKDAHIVCLCSSSGAQAFANNPDINEIKVIEGPSWYGGGRQSFGQSLLAYWRALRETRPDNVVNFRTQSCQIDHVLVWLAGISKRIGFGNRGLGYLLTYKAPAEENESQGFQKMRLVAGWLSVNPYQSLTPRFFSSTGSAEQAATLINEKGFAEQDVLIGINPGAQHTFLWPEDNFIYLCKKINQLYKIKLVFLGTAAQETMIENIRKALPFETYSLAGKTTLGSLFEILKTLRLLITVDTGARHLANAALLPQIVLRNGANSSHQFGKYVTTERIVLHHVECSPCGQLKCPLQTVLCMTGIQPDVVLEQVKVELSTGPK